jgi:hypothetical protein
LEAADSPLTTTVMTAAGSQGYFKLYARLRQSIKIRRDSAEIQNNSYYIFGIQTLIVHQAPAARLLVLSVSSSFLSPAASDTLVMISTPRRMGIWHKVRRYFYGFYRDTVL